MNKRNLPEGYHIVPPHIYCVDYWPRGISREKLAAYRQMMDEGQLADLHGIFNKSFGSLLIFYFANQPHEWVLEALARRLPAPPHSSTPQIT